MVENKVCTIVIPVDVFMEPITAGGGAMEKVEFSPKNVNVSGNWLVVDCAARNEACTLSRNAVMRSST